MSISIPTFYIFLIFFTENLIKWLIISSILFFLSLERFKPFFVFQNYFCYNMITKKYTEVVEVIFLIGNIVKVIVDKPLGSHHPKHKDIYYPVNYGYIEGMIAPDGEEQDAYILGVDEPVNEFIGKVIAIIHRNDDIEEKLVVVPEEVYLSAEQIMEGVAFMERYFDSEIIM